MDNHLISFFFSFLVAALNYALAQNLCTYQKIFEIWDFQKSGPIFKKVVSLLINYKENNLKDDVPAGKFIKSGLQKCFGKFSMRPKQNSHSMCHSFEELNGLLTKDRIKVTNINPLNDEICEVSFETLDYSRNAFGSVVIGSHITWFGRVYLQMKIMEIFNNFPNVKIMMLNTDSVVFSTDEKFKLAEKIVISEKNGEWKNQIKNVKEITNFYALNSVTYHLTFSDQDDNISQMNKIAGFKLDTLLAPELKYTDFDKFLSLAINAVKSKIEMSQFKKFKDSPKIKTLFTLKNNLDNRRYFKKGHYCSFAYRSK